MATKEQAGWYLEFQKDHVLVAADSEDIRVNLKTRNERRARFRAGRILRKLEKVPVVISKTQLVCCLN